MKICLVSDSDEFCSPLADGQVGITTLTSTSKGPIPESDVYIWDHSADFEIQSEVALRPNAQHLILSDPKHLPFLSELQTSTSFCILLKPVTALTLKAFAEFAWRSWQLRQQTSEVDQLRSDRDALLQYVLEVNLKLQEYDQERNNFLARALHDFRTPLTALHGYCGLLCEGRLGEVSAAQKELLTRMLDSTKRLTRLAGSTLDLLLEGRFEKAPARTAGDIERTMQQALHDLYPSLREKNLTLTLSLEPPEGTLLFESEQIQQVIVNLLENSCKFTPRSGTIQLRAYPAIAMKRPDGDARYSGEDSVPDAYQIDVLDSGPGVPPELAQKIFEQYASYSGGSDRSGGGIGLAVCRAIINAHGGSIWATPGTDGGRFSFQLPMDAKTDMAEGKIAFVSGESVSVHALDCEAHV